MLPNCCKWNLIQNIPAVKKCEALKKAIVKKMWNPKWQPRNGCDGRLNTKILPTTIQLNLCCLLCYDSAPNSYKLLLLKFLHLAYRHSHFLATTLNFTSFFTRIFLGAAYFSLQLGCFGLDFTSFCNCVLWNLQIACFL